MCGILGVLRNPTQAPNHNFIQSFFDALELIAYRGPDGGGFYSNSSEPIFFDKSYKKQELFNRLNASWQPIQKNASIFFGHRRLSILDLSSHAFLPMCITRPDQSKVWLIYNGEVYNYIELRKILIEKGFEFNTDSDSEVLLRAYEYWGLDCFKHFNGMWSVALWDDRSQELILSRDRLGVKPLYYSLVHGQLVFGSEIKQILNFRKNLGIQKHWNTYRLYEFLAFAQQHHAQDTLYEDVFAFPAGSYARISIKEIATMQTMQRQIKAFWNFPNNETQCSFDEAAKKTYELLESSVKLRLRSDVAVGSALSGGLDSSAIVSIIAKLNPKKQKTFSAIFPNFSLNEKPYIDDLVGRYPIEAVFTEPKADTLLNDIEKLIFHQDGPFITTSMYAQWEVFRSAKQNNVTVTLDGQGADEIFAGYTGFFRSYFKSMYSSQSLAKTAVQSLLFLKNHYNYLFTQKIKSKLSYNSINWITCFSPTAREQLLEKMQFFKKFGDHLRFGTAGPQYSPLKKALYEATTCTSLPALLMFEDRNSMAFSVESRTPFLDYRLVELAFQCPDSFHIRNGRRKTLLNAALQNTLPPLILNRKDKIGFTTPEDEWKQTFYNPLYTRALNKLEPSLFDPLAIQSALKLSTQRNFNNPYITWRLLSVLLSG